jgi:electron transfer flavoprotein-quinone oxidoreductase
MTTSNFDVIVVGAGCAGLTAAIGLARAGFSVAVLEAADYPGAENWSGCVYFCESLAHPDILGPEGVEALAWERRLVERGFFACDGHSLLGMTYRDPEAFRHCYTVLRPIFDLHLAQAALRQGVALLNATTAESLIRDAGQVIGVCTQRGPLYADLVFLAEGDASHLVTREGYERFADPREAPHFLQGIKEVIELPPGAIEERFGVGPEEGVAYEMVLRNGSLRGRPVRLNMGGFVYANRQSLSVGLVLPADNLAEHFEGDPNLLIAWFENLPALEPWLRGGRRSVFGAKLIRGGGSRDIPTLIDDGLAIGGAASAIGIDFPYPNFTGPATAMGLLLTQAAVAIRAAGGRFTRAELRTHYLEPLRRTHHWQDVDFLRRWPGYVQKTRYFFGANLDLALGSAYVWTRPRTWTARKWMHWVQMIRQVAGPRRWPEMQEDLNHLSRALRLRNVLKPPDLGRLLLDGTVNALRDIFHRPRANLPPAGAVRLRYRIGGRGTEAETAPRWLRRWFNRFAPILAAAARTVYANDRTPLSAKLRSALELLTKQVNLLDLLGGACIGIVAAATGALMAGWDRLRGLFRKKATPESSPGVYPEYARVVRRTGDLTPALAAGRHWDDRLGRLAYDTVKESHIQVLWPMSLPDKDQVPGAGLWHVCPAHVYEARVSPAGQVQVVVNFENCIKCETCWRTSPLVDWGRDGRHRFVYPVHSPVMARLLEDVEGAALSRPALPRGLDPWETNGAEAGPEGEADRPDALNGQAARELGEIGRLLEVVDHKLREFDEALVEEPRTIDRARAEYLEMLARYAHQASARAHELLRGSTWKDRGPAGNTAHARLLQLTAAMVAKAEERSRRAWDGHYSWAAADGRQIRWHHLAGLRRLLEALRRHYLGPLVAADPLRAWLQAESDADAVAGPMAEIQSALDRAFPAASWRARDRGEPLTAEQDQSLRALIARIPMVDTADLTGTLHPPLRKGILAELGRRDPALAYRMASHLWARDLARLASAASPLTRFAQRWARGEEWACLAVLDRRSQGASEALLVPAREARNILALGADRLWVIPVVATGEGLPGVSITPVGSLGLRGAGLVQIRVAEESLQELGINVDPDRLERLWCVLSAADLTSIAQGMAAELCRRAVVHATTRVQFPGLFLDDQARDPIGKFGAVKRLVAEMAAAHYLIQTLDHALTPGDFSAASVTRAGLVKAVVAEALGTAPGSLTYNAGQVFGGTGYSEDDTLARFYRDAAAWRFLGMPNSQVFRQHGEDVLRHWRADGQRLAGLPDEPQLFEELAQRKALQAEMDEVRVLRSRLRGLVGERLAALRGGPAPAVAADRVAEIGEQVGRQDAHLLASKALLLRTHARLEEGLPAEVETVLVRVWLERAQAWVDEFEDRVKDSLDAAGSWQERPVVDPAAGPPVTSYAEFLAADLPYESGDFLSQPVDLTRPRYVPEMNDTDLELARRDQQIRALFREQFGPLRDGLPFERSIERRHRPDAADLDFCREHGFFGMPIPPALGGEGRRKVDYYLVTTNAQRLADVAISLTIQVNTSLGTTPVLLARDKDLPRALEELGPFVADDVLQGEIRDRLQNLARRAAAGDHRGTETAYRELGERLEQGVLRKSTVRAVCRRFGERWQEAGRAWARADRAAAQQALAEGQQAWPEICAEAAELHGELRRRREACDLFLRWVASGQISAFALTEPSAGSDTARVATRARLCSVPVEMDADGVLHFVPAGSQEPRVLLDARRLEFRPDGAYYRWSDRVQAAPIHFDEYDYQTDDPERKRSYEHGNRRVYFTDIAQLRERGGQLWYDYYELTGAKMWITNGRISGVMCLYARTESGVTGFMVDRHAEGLVVGKDEDKLGQCGSPTNELSLQKVRVPRENVLGLEGRGQVNALETLNVGRAGLAMSAMAQMPGLIDMSRTYAQEAFGQVPDWVEWRLARMAEDCFIAEALAHDVIGRFEHPRTRSVRMESAIAKMLISELLHRVIETAEEVHGLAGQTTQHLVEKRKRDARVLTIYEGTNEVQRFLILKDLAEAVPRWGKGPAGGAPAHLGREALELEALKAALRQRAEAAVAFLGPELWQNPNLQANGFLLSEAAAWLLAGESTLGRLAWLSRRLGAEEDAEPAPPVALGRRAWSWCAAEVRHRLRRFDEELTHWRRGFYAPEIRAAGLLFDRPAAAPAFPRPEHQVAWPLSILVVVEPGPAKVPHPYVLDGRLLEPHLTLNEADRSALEIALQIQEQAPADVRVHVAGVGPRMAAPALREALSLGADSVHLLVPEVAAVAPDGAALALAGIVRVGGPYDLILGGAGRPGEDEGQLARLTAEALGVPHRGEWAGLAMHAAAGQGEVRLLHSRCPERRQPLPAAVAVEAGQPLRPFTTAGYLANLGRSVLVHRWPRKIEQVPLLFAEGQDTAAPRPEDQPTSLGPEEAGRWILDALGRDGDQERLAVSFAGEIRDAREPCFFAPAKGPSSVLAVVACDAAGRIQPTAAAVLGVAGQLAQDEEEPAQVLAVLVVPAEESVQRLALGQLKTWFVGDVVLVVLPGAGSADDGCQQPLVQALGNMPARPLAVVGEAWTESAFARLALQADHTRGVVTRVRGLVEERGRLVLETARAGGKLRVRQTRTLQTGQTLWISLAEDAPVQEAAKQPVSAEPVIERWAPRPGRAWAPDDLDQVLTDLRQDTGLTSLRDADFIIDVGFGVGNRDGYESVIEPLERALRALGVKNLAIGGSRKATEELHLLPADRQIGQSGVSVNPQILLAIGVSGAPQHLNYIGPRARILAFNREPDAPLMTLNDRKPLPRVYPVVGDLFETVPAFIAALRLHEAERAGESAAGEPTASR